MTYGMACPDGRVSTCCCQTPSVRPLLARTGPDPAGAEPPGITLVGMALLDDLGFPLDDITLYGTDFDGTDFGDEGEP